MPTFLLAFLSTWSVDDLVWLGCLALLAWTLWLGFQGDYAGMLFLGTFTAVGMSLMNDKRERGEWR